MPDPEDRKPDDWVEVKRIRDPSDVKPADWDESQPEFIVDEAAVKPADWLEEEPLQIPDPSARVPEDWDEEEYGAYEAPLVANPRCEEVSGCGRWEKPLIPNPAYKGRYEYRTIPNPAYKGPWMPRIIANPDAYVEERPHNLPAIGGVAIEIWTMQEGVAFDNLLVTHDETCAERFADATFRVKHALEAGEEEEESEGEKRRARMSVGGFVNDWIDETFHLEYDAKRWSRVERGLVIGSIAVVGVCVVVFLRNREFIEKAKLLWGVCFQSIVSFVLVGMEMKVEKRESVVKEE